MVTKATIARQLLLCLVLVFCQIEVASIMITSWSISFCKFTITCVSHTIILFYLLFKRYVLTTLDQLVAEDYVLIYFHGATPKSCIPRFSWVKNCYQMIDRRLRKNLKRLYLVHPTLWLKAAVLMCRPFIRFRIISRKLWPQLIIVLLFLK